MWKKLNAVVKKSKKDQLISFIQIDLDEIENVFKARYSESLDDFIKDDCSGDYRRMLRALLGYGMDEEEWILKYI